MTPSQNSPMATTKTNKKLEIQQREELLLETASQILLSEGYSELSMERLAEELGAAKGTVYNHFPNREEIVLAIAVRAVNKRQSLFDAASTSKGSSRMRMMAVGVAQEIYVRDYPGYFLVENLVRHAAIWERCSEARRQLMKNCEQRCMGLAAGIARSAMADGDLELPPDCSPEEMVLSLWALTSGPHLIGSTSPSLLAIGIRSVHRSVRIGILSTINGFGWKPAWNLKQQEEKIQQICRSVFPNEQPLPGLDQIEDGHTS